METLQQRNYKSMIDFVRLNKGQQVRVLNQEAVLLDLYSDKTTNTRLYFYNGFFIEETLSKGLNEIIDIIPFKSGYRIKDYAKVEISSKVIRANHFHYCVN